MTTDEIDIEDYRLPRSVVPHRYQLEISPDLERATFSGEEHVALEIAWSTDRIVMNALDLEIERAMIVAQPGDAQESDHAQNEPTEMRLRIELDEANERVAFVADTMLVPGSYVFSCTFAGELNDKLRGFYRSQFVDDDGMEHTIATTQFESTDARRAFPCFDEPDRKAVFSVTLDAPPGMLALSNGPEIAREDLGGGNQRIRFGDTIAMSTYLVAFVVGPLETTPVIDVDGVALRVVHTPGKAHLTQAALETAAHALRFFADYFAIPYPGEKVDLVAIPDFAAGAMENLGCITFREAILLADPKNTAQTELERLAEVVEHELAHMWFGDLVTMGWWNGIWLNEAFATYMSLRCQDDFRPEWQCFVSFARGKSAALAIDGLHATRPIEFPVRHPDESSAMFDVLTYEKGASVLWMIDEYLGGHRFRDGVRRYLAAHKYANTETGDLWDAIESEAGDVPIRSIMDSWIFQGGYPLVFAETESRDDRTESIMLRQAPFSYLPADQATAATSAIGANWLIPVLTAQATATSEGRRRVLVGTEPEHIDTSGGPTIVNAGGAGFYRLHYDDSLKAGLLDALTTLSPLERYNLVADTWAVVSAGQAPLGELFAIIGRLGEEHDPHVWSVVIGALGLLDLVAKDSDRPAFEAYVRAVLTPQLNRIGWDGGPSEDEQTPVLRASVISTLGTIGEDKTVIDRARALFAADHAEAGTIDADIARVVLGVVAADGGRAEFDQILDRYRHPRSPLDEVRHLGALGAFRDLTLAGEVHALCLGEIRSQNAPYTLGQMLRNRSVGTATWDFISGSFDSLIEQFPETSIHRMLEGIAALVELDERGESRHLGAIETFVASHIEGGRVRLVMQSIERLRVNLAFAKIARNDLQSLLLELGARGNTT